MKKLCTVIMVMSLCAASPAVAQPEIHPTGVTIYKPEKAWPGYTLLGVAPFNQSKTEYDGSYLINMNGDVLKKWPLYDSVKIYPGGYVSGQRGVHNSTKMLELDWDGNVVWSYLDHRMNHDAQRWPNPVGYYTPEKGMEPPALNAPRTLINSGEGLLQKHDMPNNLVLRDCQFFEVDWSGKVLWQWKLSDHWKELNLSEKALKALAVNKNYDPKKGLDWAHINSLSYVGPNPWYDAGDNRFNPENILFSIRNINFIGIVDKKSGKIVWRLGPDAREQKSWIKIGQLIGPHGAHIIPKGLPGAGNLLVFDNGGYGGLGNPTGTSPDGNNVERRHYSRVLEINPVTFQTVWEYSTYTALQPTLKGNTRQVSKVFFSLFTSNAQRLPNGNTLICEGGTGRIFEVTADNELVWEFVDYYSRDIDNFNTVFRAYRIPYEWIPQLTPPKKEDHKAVIPPRMIQFRLIPGENGSVAKPVVIDEQQFLKDDPALPVLPKLD